MDENTRFIDGGMLPCVLVQNKIDLVDEEQLKDSTELKQFAETNIFDNHFRTSAKMGLGIDECMDFLIKTILDRSEKVAKEGEDPFEQDRKSLVLDRKKNNNNNDNAGGCC